MTTVLLLETAGQGQANLPLLRSEIQDVLGSGLTIAKTLIDAVSLPDLVRAVRDAVYDVLWVAGHAGAGGLPLSDGLLSPASFTALVRGRFGLIYINTCESLALAQMIQNETGAAVVCTVAPVPDATAYQTGSLFAAELARTGDFRAAYNRSRPGENKDYILLAGEQGSRTMMTDKEMEHALHQEIARLSQGIANLAQQIYEMRAEDKAEITILKARTDAVEAARVAQVVETEELKRQAAANRAAIVTLGVERTLLRLIGVALALVAVVLIYLVIIHSN